MVKKGQRGPDGRCGAKTRGGSTCRKSPLIGATRCKLHGGATPNSLEAAKKRLLAALDPAAAELVDLVQNKEVRLVKTKSGEEVYVPAVSDAVRLKAIEAIMDRVGLPKRREVTGEDGGPIIVQAWDPKA